MVSGFTPANGLVRLDGIGADPAAVMRGGDMLVDPQTGAITNIPWSDGSGDKLVITPRVIDCGVAASPVETAAGFEIAYANGVRMQTHNFSTERKLPVLADVDFPASKSLLWLPPGMIHDSGDGFWRPPKEYEVSGIGINSGTWHHQPDESSDPDVEQKWWAIGAWNRYHDWKANNCPTRGKNYMTGKEGTLLPPSLVLWNQGRILKIFRGIIEWIDPVTFRKAFSMAEIQPYLGAFDEVSVDATLGYTSTGIYGYGSQGSLYAQNIYTMPENGTISSISFCCGYDDTSVGGLNGVAIYTGAVADSTITILANAEKYGLRDSADPVGGIPSWLTWTFTTPPTAAKDAKIYMAREFNGASVRAYCRFDTRAAANDIWIVSDVGQPFPDPIGVAPSSNTRLFSQYITYAGGGQPACRRRPWYSKAYRVN